jgi:hypothetical protein
MSSRVSEEYVRDEWESPRASHDLPAIIETEYSPAISRVSIPNAAANHLSFSPPASVISFSSHSRPGTADYSPVHTAPIFIAGSSSPDGRVRKESPSSSVIGSGTTGVQPGNTERPGTAGSSRARRRESFQAPNSRPLIPPNSTLPTTKFLRGDRMRSTMLSSNPPILKPWLDEKRDPYSRVAYFLTYGMIFLGVVCGALRCFFAWRGVQLLTDKLCLVMEDDFDGTELSNNWMQEVQMGGFG